MMSRWRASLVLGLWAAVGIAHAKLPVPNLTEEQKAAAELAKAKAAHQAKVDAYLTCKAAEKAAANYFQNHPQAVKPANAPTCVDPGPFVPPAAADAPAPAAAKKS